MIRSIHGSANNSISVLTPWQKGDLPLNSLVMVFTGCQCESSLSDRSLSAALHRSRGYVSQDKCLTRGSNLYPQKRTQSITWPLLGDATSAAGIFSIRSMKLLHMLYELIQETDSDACSSIFRWDVFIVLLCQYILLITTHASEHFFADVGSPARNLVRSLTKLCVND